MSTPRTPSLATAAAALLGSGRVVPRAPAGVRELTACFLFLLVNATLFIRPGEIVPSLEGTEVYLYCILTCLVVAAPDVLRYLTDKPLVTQPITLMIFGMVGAVFVAGVVAGDVTEAWHAGFHFAKNVLYFLLLVSLITTPTRLRILLICILMSLATVTLLAVLRYHDVIQMTALRPAGESGRGIHGEVVAIRRLSGSGLFGDPNEMCVMLAASVPWCLCFLMGDRNLFFRAFSAGYLAVATYAIYLTQSRGGLLAVMGGLGCLFWSRYGWKKTVLLGLVGLPLVLLLAGGRQTDISTSTGTARSRIEMWSAWFMVFRDNMVTGNGLHFPKEADALDAGMMVAHNSYLQCFADLGFVGGCLFLGAVVTAIWSLLRYNAPQVVWRDQDLKHLQPFVLASIIAYGIGMFSLSLSYIVPTYLIVGQAVVVTLMAQRLCLFAPAPLRIDNARLLGAIAAAGVCFLIAIYVFVRLFG